MYDSITWLISIERTVKAAHIHLRRNVYWNLGIILENRVDIDNENQPTQRDGHEIYCYDVVLSIVVFVDILFVFKLVRLRLMKQLEVWYSVLGSCDRYGLKPPLIAE